MSPCLLHFEKAVRADYFVFNGDADGICSVQQMRLAGGRPRSLITGVKRDQALLAKIESAHNVTVAVFDLSLDNNKLSLRKLLGQGCEIGWFDHHVSEFVLDHPRLNLCVDSSAATSTSMLVDRGLNGAYRKWAIVGLFGDNLGEAAESLCREQGITDEIDCLRMCGELLNYNAYGRTLQDLLWHPIELLEKMSRFGDPTDFFENTGILASLKLSREQDLERASRSRTIQPNIFILPDEVWARRVVGEFANSLAVKYPERAHMVLVEHAGKGYVVSVRSPMLSSFSAVELCKKFPTGGGREKAAGINILPAESLDGFIEAFNDHFQS